MNLEQQVCTIEQSKKLKELLKNYETNFYWVELPEGNHLATKKNVDDNLAFDRSLGDNMVAINMLATAWKSIHPAYTVAELGKMIGKGTEASQNHWQWLLDCVNSGLSGTVAYNPVALAGFVITQIEAGFLNPEEVNQRLNQ